MQNINGKNIHEIHTERLSRETPINDVSDYLRRHNAVGVIKKLCVVKSVVELHLLLLLTRSHIDAISTNGPSITQPLELNARAAPMQSGWLFSVWQFVGRTLSSLSFVCVYLCEREFTRTLTRSCCSQTAVSATWFVYSNRMSLKPPEHRHTFKWS